MKYFVTSDVHGFYTPLRAALDNNGFDENNSDHMLVICGDLMDRGSEALELQEYIVHLLEKQKVILIKGNHESLMEEYIEDLAKFGNKTFRIRKHHKSNGTIDTALQLTNYALSDSINDCDNFRQSLIETPFVSKLIPASIPYFETKHYVFTHGFIPTIVIKDWTMSRPDFKYDKNWRQRNKAEWEQSSWDNGMEMVLLYGITEPNKTIVVGHWHTGWAHYYFGDGNANNCDMFVSKDKSLIALDATTALSGKVNMLVVED